MSTTDLEALRLAWANAETASRALRLALANNHDAIANAIERGESDDTQRLLSVAHHRILARIERADLVVADARQAFEEAVDPQREARAASLVSALHIAVEAAYGKG